MNPVLYKSKTGEVGLKEAFEEHLDVFWKLIETGELRGSIKRPVDAWERYVKLLGLKEVV